MHRVKPIITGNSIFNNSRNFTVTFQSYSSRWYAYSNAKSQNMLDARGNWWGTNNPVEISASIGDTNTTGVDYRNFLLSENGPPTQANYLLGIVDVDTLEPGTTYEALESLVVPAGRALEIKEGVNINAIGAGKRLLVGGDLTISGTKKNPVVLRSFNLSTSSISPVSSPNILVNYLHFENGSCLISGKTNANISNSIFKNYSYRGIETNSTGTVLLSNNLFYPTNSTQSQTTGIHASWGALTIQENTLFGNTYGIYVNFGAPNISNGNVITGNENGIWVSEPTSSGLPKTLPVVTNNSIFDNSQLNYHVNGSTGDNALTLDASNNWWGTTDTIEIEAKIRDINESPTTAPRVNYIPYQGMDSIPLALSLYTPTDGEITTQATYYITGAINKPAQLTVNSASVSPNPVLDFNYGPVTLSEGENLFTLVATDLSGDSVATTATITLDSMPPVAPDTALISAPVSGADTVTITGANGSVEPLSTITLVNSRTGSTATATADTNGGFTIIMQGQPGDDLAIYVADGANQQSLWSWTQVEGAAPTSTLTIDQPVDGSSVDGRYITVQGAIQSPVNTGIAVNGIVGAIYGDQFVVNRIPLNEAGPTTLSAQALTPDGQTLAASVNVSPSGELSPDITLSPATGIAPLPVTFNVSSTSLNDINSVSIDVDNDGTIDLTDTDITYTYGGTVTVIVNGNPVEISIITDAAASYTYPAPGIYTASIQVTDANSVTRSYQQTVVVESLAGVDARLRKTYSNMLDLLKAGNTQSALLRIDAHARDQYASVFTDLATLLNTITDQQRNILNGSIGREWAAYTVLRNTGSSTQAFSINFIKGRDGVWRIQNM